MRQGIHYSPLQRSGHPIEKTQTHEANLMPLFGGRAILRSMTHSIRSLCSVLQLPSHRTASDGEHSCSGILPCKSPRSCHRSHTGCSRCSVGTSCQDLRHTGHTLLWHCSWKYTQNRSTCRLERRLGWCVQQRHVLRPD